MALSIKSRTAFSLVELLVVLAVLAILAALLLPVVSQAKARAHLAKCANNVRQLGIALQGYVTENHAYPLGRNLTPNSIPAKTGRWDEALQESELGSLQSNSFFRFIPQGVWKCPDANKPADYWEELYCSYGYNCYGVESHGNWTNSLGLGGHIVSRNDWPVKESEVVSPSQMIAIGDGFAGGSGVIRDGVGNLERAYGIPDFGVTARAYARHQGKANVVFCDGHVESPTLKFLFEDTSDEALSRWNRDHQPHRDKL
jgi:prepilin-type processing-associated H-X9-DG protein/prepilin-type N-terminal cleavage/methylation domain-containing protein